MPSSWMKRIGSILFGATFAMLVGCGGGGGGGEPPAQGDDRGYYPAASGDRWVYRASENGNEEVLQVKATGHTTSRGVSTLMLETHRASDGALLGTRYMGIDATGVTEFPAPEDGVTPPLIHLRFPVMAGDRYPGTDVTYDLGTDFDGDGRSETVRVESSTEVIGFETVSTEEGALPNAVRVRTVFDYTGRYSGGSPSIRWTMTYDDWYVDGIGLAREELIVRDEDGAVIDTLRSVLVSHAVGGRKSDSVAPRATLISPQAGVTQNTDVQFELGFSEPMDIGSVTSGVSLRAPSGAVVAVSVTAPYADRQWQIIPSSRLQESGSYTLSLEGATDLVGNRVDSTWQINVDATSPTVVATHPPNGATNVALDTVITIDFSEEIDPNTLWPGDVWMSGPDFSAPATVSLQGLRMIVTPPVPLQVHGRYHIHLSQSIRDRLGNFLFPGFDLIFSTDPGAFSYPVYLEHGMAPLATAVGDVNGDGRNDFLMANRYYTPWENDVQLYIYLQQPDGGLAAAVKVPTQSTADCLPSSLAVADFDGDGRQEVAVGESGCGIEVFQQTPDNRLASHRFLATPQSHAIIARDMNADGRVDLVGVGNGGSQVAVWAQDAAGAFPSEAVFTLRHGTEPDLDVGDVNGDGRLDIVVSNADAPSEGVGILHGQSGGSFGGARYLSTSGVVQAVAAGDLNSDGRTDLVAGRWMSGALSVYFQQGDGTLGSPQSIALRPYSGSTALELADVDNDGRLDIVSAYGDGFTVVQQQSDGLLGPALWYPAIMIGGSAQSLSVGDLSGDGLPDLAAPGVYLINQGAEAISARKVAKTKEPSRPTAPLHLRPVRRLGPPSGFPTPASGPPVNARLRQPTG